MTPPFKSLILKQFKHLPIEMSNKDFLNWFFVIEVVLFGLIITGILPRSVVPYFAGALAVYVLFASLEDATVFFVRSIPFFLAIPLTATFDNFNTWRILAAIIFLKWLYKEWPNYRKYLSLPLLLLLITSVLSIIPASDKILAVKRIIYFLNLSLIGFVIYDLVKNQEFAKRLIKNIAIPVIIVTIVGFIQLASTYFIDIYQFMRIWGEGIQCRQFGTEWCNIAVQFGNTWFAYYREQLSLRVFSLFPDSHSFPQFVLLGLPAIFAISLQKILNLKSKTQNLSKMIRTRANMSVLWIPAMFLIVILSGTRGIWAASIGVIMAICLVLYWLKRDKKHLAIHHDRGGLQGQDLNYREKLFKYIPLYLTVFFLLFTVAYPIFVSPQFLLSKGDWGLFGSRIKSIIDFGETSNAQRIEIWKKTLISIKARPLLGVGIGNFPVVLNQDLALAKAGSSAHNIYLQIAAEMGIPALIFALWFLWTVFKKNYQNFIRTNLYLYHDRDTNQVNVFDKNMILIIYYGAALIFVPWVLIYSLTDVALFDERAFLLFVVTTALIFGLKIRH